MSASPYRKHENPLGWTRDHLVPAAFGTTLHRINLVLAHTKCNSRRGNAILNDETLLRAVAVFGWTDGEKRHLFELRDKALAHQTAYDLHNTEKGE